MCGIAGIVAPDPAGLRPIAEMTAALRHRGPDDEGYLLADTRRGLCWRHRGPDTVAAIPDLPLPAQAPAGCEVALGHRRLSILDLSPAGHGPMASADGKLWVTYNGEIYNYTELREELRGLGHSFRTGSDTEVLLAAWTQWGPAALARCNGMFAFGLLDLSRRALWLVRDRFGVKPLFHARAGTAFVFASELAALLAHPGVPSRPDGERLVAFLGAGAVDEGEATFLKDARSLPAGHLARLDLHSGALAVERWYSLPEPEPRPDRGGEIAALLEDAVRLRLRSDVPVGTCLSGGLDSSMLVALTARLRGEAAGHRAFSVVYPEPGIDEGPFVDAVVASTGVAGSRATPVAAELLAELPALVRHQGEPFPSLGPYSQWRVMRMAREAGVPVLLDGQGGDEVFGGYHYHYGPFLAEQARSRGLGAAIAEARAAAAVTSLPLAFLLGLGAYHLFPAPEALRRIAVARTATHGRVPAGLLLEPPSEDAGLRHRPRGSLLAERRAALLATSLPALLRYEDRSSMAFSIEARTPYLDFRLVERALALPSAGLIRDGWTKQPLREAARGVLPESVRLRRDKLGFATPERRFLRELAPAVREWLGPPARIRAQLRAPELERWLALPDALLAAQPGLWRLCSAELWLRALEGRLAA
jgi:asparagine synthase (glutamine-hydrolysing)